MPLDTATDIISELARHESHRAEYETGWNEIADDVLGLRHFNFTHSRATQRYKQIYDTTGLSAGNLLSGTLNGLLTNPGARWSMAIVPPGVREIGENNDYLVHLDETMDRFYKVPIHGFPTASTEWYTDYTFFGNAGMHTSDVPGTGPVDRAYPLGQLYVDEGADGRVDTVFRVYPITVRTFVDVFGFGISEEIDRLYATNWGREVEMVHVVHPRADLTKGSKALKDRRPVRSVHVLKNEKKIVRESGEWSFPWQFARWLKEAGEKYGYGPAWQALPDCQSANEFRRIMLVSAQKDVEPPLLVPSDGVLTQIDTAPNALTVYEPSAFSQNPIQEFPRGRTNTATVETINDTRNQIKERFFAHLLQLFDSNVNTATQLLEMESKAARILVSIISRAAAEFAAPSLSRKFDIANRAGMFDGAPESLNGVPIGIRYLNPIMRTQAQMETRATLNVYAAAKQIVEASGNVSVMDNLNDDDSIRRIAENEGMDLSGLRSVEQRELMREIRARQEQEMQEREALAQGAETIAKVAPALREAA